jgi:hypothetical protein
MAQRAALAIQALIARPSDRTIARDTFLKTMPFTVTCCTVEPEEPQHADSIDVPSCQHDEEGTQDDEELAVPSIIA